MAVDKSKIVVGARITFCGATYEVVAIHAPGEGPHSNLWVVPYVMIRPLTVNLESHPIETLAQIADEIV